MVIGSTISHYKIVEKLGEGGMGVVYKAEDKSLERTFALKFLAQHLLNDKEAKERFLREAKAAASLSHPNICHVYEIAEADDKTFIAMEFVQGETLEERIAEGPLSLKDALDIGRQIADGLEAAHERKIIHRDIKPANILIDTKGRPMVMDFGLARLTEASRLTKKDMAMGTVAYMSPEHAQGVEVDSRTDIWALGCVMYEMVAGQRPFQGQYDQALLYEIVHEEAAPLTSIRAGVPMELEFIVGKCLAKDRDDRYNASDELSKDLRTLGEKLRSGRSTILRTSVQKSDFAAPQPTRPSESTIRLSRTWQLAAAICALILVGIAAFHFVELPPEESERIVTRFSFVTEGLVQGTEGTGAAPATISPDGRYILITAASDGVSRLWLRSLDDETVREIPGTEGALGGFWSPDSQSVGYAVGAPATELRRISIEGGGPVLLCKLPESARSNYPFYGGTWSADGQRIVFASGMLLYEIPSRGGQPTLLFEDPRSPGVSFLLPRFLPLGDGPPTLLYTFGPDPETTHVAVMNLTTGERRELGPGGRAIYSPDGFLIQGLAGCGKSLLG